MFQYTTETIINSANGNLSCEAVGGSGGGTAVSNKRFMAVRGADGKNYTAAASTGVNGNDTVIIDGVALLKQANISAQSKTAYAAAVNETLKITMPAVGSPATYAVGDVLRLKIRTTQEGLVSAIYGDTQRIHAKPFFYEITVTTATAAGIAAQFADAITKEMRSTDFRFFSASSNNADLTLTAKDCYTRFYEVQVSKVPIEVVTTANLGSIITGYQDFTILGGLDWKRPMGDVASKFDLTAGSEGNGTVARLIKNLRVPTDANTDPFGVNFGGKPIPGGEYNQYVVEYVTDRRHVGGQVVGAMDKSIVTHVFFVESGAVTAFEAVFTAIGKSF